MEPESDPQGTPQNVFANPKDDENKAKVVDISGNEKPEVLNTNRYHSYDQSSALVCNDCGCLVLNARVHDDFHGKIDSLSMFT